MRNKKNDFQKILITGAGSGLGKQASIVLSSMGYEVFAGVEFDEEIEDFEKIIIQNDLKIHVFKMNILEKNDRNLIVDFAIDILVCNAFLPSYCATKFALDCFGTCLRQEMKLLNKLK